MKNIIKMLSANKDYRVVVTDTLQIAEKELGDFAGQDGIRRFLEQIITNCTLLSAMNDFSQKISFVLRLTKDITISCMISNSKLHIYYTAKLNEFDGTISDLFDDKSMLSITTGDWETGLHTGTVEAHIDNVDMLFAHFTVQSEQLPSHFIMAGTKTTRGLLVQPLPFADEKLMEQADRELVYLSTALEQTDWKSVLDIYRPLATVISESEIASGMV
ncbi:MAG: Hsp33 family molecular chaperone HslO [Lachnospiraceae bacterium]|nr:Hsp33 family molecular chaperone HslO [Lachnospiraceae bacterium]